jgi:hypothetical protein
MKTKKPDIWATFEQDFTREIVMFKPDEPEIDYVTVREFCNRWRSDPRPSKRSEMVQEFHNDLKLDYNAFCDAATELALWQDSMMVLEEGEK